MTEEKKKQARAAARLITGMSPKEYFRNVRRTRYTATRKTQQPRPTTK